MSDFTWSKYNGPIWCIRGPSGFEPGHVVRVARKDGSTSEETISAVLRDFSGGISLYLVKQKPQPPKQREHAPDRPKYLSSSEEQQTQADDVIDEIGF